MRKASSRSTKRRPPGRPSTLQSRPPRARTASAGQALPSPGEGKRGEDGHLAYLLRQAQAAARLSLERALASTGLTHPQFVVLTMLKAYPGLSGADCARMALLTPQTVNVIIGNLERDGAIRRAPHPVHGRMLQWTLTARGLALLAKARRGANALEQRLAAGLGKRDVATIRRWLARIAAEFHPD
ncbi:MULTISPECIES: MarR family winged helix-turn-helix transcriptional regulator [Bradyrhizobium]|jgi:DNA-binding MarR family transcriptional regulator|uniref:MarR family winged helix-turn-helix transcriptional regulator n=3 Tax=Nitrobacteraceae TaxID=41294 RepID=UPI0003AAD6CF|nr:MarR family transcriptional regulator [Bradyrhizobium denitrificans]MCL8484825.1 MarR family transcriptional regulator [Bradyrhizobium denitrificans]RTL98663.1 MAG: MarR family transcriptional regulator [Bradyrhizobiaceae bacterium]